MPRQRLSEYRSKKLVSDALGLSYKGWSVNVEKPIDEQLKELEADKKYVVKVDQGVKGRFKKGLVLLDISSDKVDEAVNSLAAKGYVYFIIEPQTDHESTDEKYLSISYDKGVTTLNYSASGGIDIEDNASTITSIILDSSTDFGKVCTDIGFTEKQLKALLNVFSRDFMTLLEINPYLEASDGLLFLDLAIEIDDAGGYFVNDWSQDDFRRSSSKKLTDQEKTVREIDENSPASLKLEVLNPDGSIFLLLSGGGASVVVADEVHNLGLGKELANYGEYSGNPNTEETYLYTKALLELLIASKAKHKVLFIGGAVANFTDIANTFTGIIRAFDDMHEELAIQKVKVFVRRGGPRQEIGLSKIKASLESYGLLGAVYDPSTPLTKVVAEAVEVVL